MRFLASVAVAFLTVGLVTNGFADDAKSDLKGIEGTWEVLQGVINGRPAPEDLSKLKFSFNENTLTISGAGRPGKHEYSFRIDPTKEPKALDISAADGPQKELSISCIYELNGDQLKLAMPNRETQARPTEFKSVPDSRIAVWVLKRAK
jgi:uncharacterized protein (TIGR03067 family)